MQEDILVNAAIVCIEILIVPLVFRIRRYLTVVPAMSRKVSVSGCGINLAFQLNS